MAFKGLSCLPLYLIKCVSPSKDFTKAPALRMIPLTLLWWQTPCQGHGVCTARRPVKALTQRRCHRHTALLDRMECEENRLLYKERHRLRVQLRYHSWFPFSPSTLLSVISWGEGTANHILGYTRCFSSKDKIKNHLGNGSNWSELKQNTS